MSFLKLSSTQGSFVGTYKKSRTTSAFITEKSGDGLGKKSFAEENLKTESNFSAPVALFTKKTFFLCYRSSCPESTQNHFIAAQMMF